MIRHAVPFLIAIMSLVDCRATRKPITTTLKPKVNCKICIGHGEDCKATYSRAGCEACAKFTGIVDNVEEIPDFLRTQLDHDIPGATEDLSEQKGKIVTVRACATRSILQFAEVSTQDDFGCIDELDGFGFTDATACLCKKDC